MTQHGWLPGIVREKRPLHGLPAIITGWRSGDNLDVGAAIRRPHRSIPRHQRTTDHRVV